MVCGRSVGLGVKITPGSGEPTLPCTTLYRVLLRASACIGTLAEKQIYGLFEAGRV